jgi:dTDP-4-dehydrorhamnose reductase
VIWLLGRAGLLGAELARAFAGERLEFVGTGHELDVHSREALSGFARGRTIDWIVNCAAYTDVDGAEEPDQRELCFGANAAGPGYLAELAAGIGARILQLSSDYVFDGERARPYLESDPIAPLGVYGRSKAEGEARVAAACPEHVILRSSWLYGEGKDNFVSTMLALMRERERLGVIADQRSCPTSVPELARAIVAIVRATTPAYGIFHCAGSGTASRYELALEAQRLGAERGLPVGDCVLEPVASAAFHAAARRPAYSVLDCGKLRDAYGIELPEWRRSLASYLGGLAE